MKLGSLFDGIGAFPLSAMRQGITPVWASEIDKSAIAVTKKHFPNMVHLGDITKISGAEIEPVDIISAGSPCFPAGTLVLTASGYKPIETITTNELVLTHTGKWQSVLRTGSTIADTIDVKGFGHYGIETTPEHPFYASEKKRKYYPQGESEKRPNPTVYMSSPQWIEAKDLGKRFWATPLHLEPLPIPPVDKFLPAHLQRSVQMDNSFWWFIGYWLGNGWVRNGQRSQRPEGQTWGQIVLAAPYRKAEMVSMRLNQLGFTWLKIEERTVVKFRTAHKELVEWLLKNFGCYAHGKHLPAWCLSMDIESLSHLFTGYLDADGGPLKIGGYSITSVSKQLAVGMRLVSERLGYASSLYYTDRPPQHTIEGRVVNQRSTYIIRARLEKKASSRKHEHGMSWGLVKSVTKKGTNVQVYNLEVANDNSYIVENIVVHNCQNLSVAGNREGLAGSESQLFHEFIRIVREMREATNNEYPRYILWENVPGAYSSNGGQDFRAVLQEILQSQIPMPKSGRWATAGMVRGAGYSLAWRTLDAQYFGVPQRRKRIFLVADFRGQSAPEILFECESGAGHFEESRDAWKEVAACTGDGVEVTSWCPKMWCSGGRISNPLLASGAEAFGVGGENKTAHSLRASPSKADKPCSTTYVLQGSMIGGDDKNGPQGDGINEDISFTLNTTDRHAVAYAICSASSNSMKSNNPHSGIYKALTSRTLDGNGGNPTCNQGGIMIVQQQSGSVSCSQTDHEHAHTFSMQRSDEYCHNDVASTQSARQYKSPTDLVVRGSEGAGTLTLYENHGQDSRITGPLEVAPTISQKFGTGGNNTPLVVRGFEGDIARTLIARQDSSPCVDRGQDLVFTVQPLALDCRNHKAPEVSGTLQSKNTGGYSLNYQNPIMATSTVRRLTPIECERLMGFPDNWTAGHSDSARYRMLGNSVAVPCAEYVFDRLRASVCPSADGDRQ